jgi:hypothetical protein
MPMPPYFVKCYSPRCGKEATFKIASRWSDGLMSELKTYALACEDCLPELFGSSRKRQVVCRLTEGESLEPPGIYERGRQSRDPSLVRRIDRERQLAGGSAAGSGEAAAAAAANAL